jgi:hypothetical protein
MQARTHQGPGRGHHAPLTGFIGYPTASGMLPYWLNVASDPQAPADQRALAGALNNLRPFLISDREEPVPWPNAELLVVHDDEQLADAVREEKAKPGKDLGVPGGIRTAQTFVRPGLVDEYVLTVHPVGAPGRVIKQRAQFCPCRGHGLAAQHSWHDGVPVVLDLPRDSICSCHRGSIGWAGAGR